MMAVAGTKLAPTCNEHSHVTRGYQARDVLLMKTVNKQNGWSLTPKGDIPTDRGPAALFQFLHLQSSVEVLCIFGYGRSSFDLRPY